MVGCEVQLRVPSSEHSAHASPSHVLMLGLILIYHNTLTSGVQGSSACGNIPSKYQHCGTHPAGVHDLDCFAKKTIYNMKCVWKPGKHTSQKTYTLIIQQLGHCEVYSNITNVSEKIKIFDNKNMTAEVFETSESANCTKAVFRGSPRGWMRCGPPYNASFWRHAGTLDVKTSWPQEDSYMITYYSVKYKTLNSRSWNESSVQCLRGKRCTVENLDSSLVYNVQMQCVVNEKCSQCPWSETYIVPSELTTQPDFDLVQDNDHVREQGRRLLSLTWRFSAKEPFDGYSVGVVKASGEPPYEQIKTNKPEVSLSLSYSAFHVSISALNNVSKSPAVNLTIPQRQGASRIRDAKLNVTVHSNKSFTVHWKDNLIKTCVCYCVEWSKKGHKAVYKSFFENEKNYRTISNLPEHLEPYERYSITLHTRPNRDTCNLKRIDSERTYGSTLFYYMQGTPVRAPANISSYNVTVDSAVLEWSPITEEDARGFLLGYTVHYVEYGPSGTEINVTVDPELNHYKLDDLKSGAAYEVQISGFTQAGGGVRSTYYLFKTNHKGYFQSNLGGIITIFAVALTVLLVGPTIIKRTKVVMWPSIPNPGNSNAMKEIEGTCELELLESINTLKVEEWDTDSLQIVEKETVIPADSLPRLHGSEDEGSASDCFQTDSDDAGGILPDATAGTVSDIPLGGFHSEYTTMEMFNQMMPQCVQANTDVSEAEDTDLTVVKSGLDYIRQFSSSPTLDSELSTFS